MGANSVIDFVKGSDIDSLTPKRNLSSPPIRRDRIYTLVTGGVVPLLSPVHAILGSGTSPEIGFSIIESVAVYVVSEHTVRSIVDHPVHADVLAATIAGSVTSAIQIPTIISEQQIIAVIYFGSYALG